MISVFSENPENDLWRELLQFSYEANINRYLSKKGLHANGETINCIVGSFLQADEYYRAAKDANLQISPLLLYYGTTNLLYGMVNLLSGRKNIIANHGMKMLVAILHILRNTVIVSFMDFCFLMTISIKLNFQIFLSRLLCCQMIVL